MCPYPFSSAAKGSIQCDAAVTSFYISTSAKGGVFEDDCAIWQNDGSMGVDMGGGVNAACRVMDGVRVEASLTTLTFNLESGFWRTR